MGHWKKSSQIHMLALYSLLVMIKLRFVTINSPDTVPILMQNLFPNLPHQHSIYRHSVLHQNLGHHTRAIPIRSPTAHGSVIFGVGLILKMVKSTRWLVCGMVYPSWTFRIHVTPNHWYLSKQLGELLMDLNRSIIFGVMSRYVIVCCWHCWW